MDFETAAKASVVVNATDVARQAAVLQANVRDVETRIRRTKAVHYSDALILCESFRGLAILLGGAAYLNEIARTLTWSERVRLAWSVLFNRAKG